MTGIGAALAAFGLVTAGVWWIASLRYFVLTPGAGPAAALARPAQAGLRLLCKESRGTEHPDRALWLGAPLLLNALALSAVAVMPLAPELIGADLSVGVVFLTAMFALVLVATFAAAWGPNSKYPLIGGYRFIGLMLAYEMPFAITIIAVALPAQSLALGDIVAAQQATVWNVLVQPVGFVIYLVCAMAVAFWGPFEQVDSADLAGGVRLELGGAPLAAWLFGRYALLLATSAFAVPLFLGGGAGPWLPAWAWTIVKVMLVTAGLVIAGSRLPRLRLERFMRSAWIGLIPLSLANLFLVGLLMLIWPETFVAGAPP